MVNALLPKLSAARVIAQPNAMYSTQTYGKKGYSIKKKGNETQTSKDEQKTKRKPLL